MTATVSTLMRSETAKLAAHADLLACSQAVAEVADYLVAAAVYAHVAVRALLG
jgi:hypothetical protein